MSKSVTIQRLCAAALRSFASRGYDGTSLREIVACASLPLGTVHNYFVSKEDLYRTVFERCLAEIHRDSQELLANARSRGPLTLSDVVNAIVDPVASRWLSRSDERRYCVIFVSRLAGAPSSLSSKIEANYQDTIAAEFASAFCEAIDGLEHEDALQYYSFGASSLYHCLAQNDRLVRSQGGDYPASHSERLVTRIKRFFAGGIVLATTDGYPENTRAAFLTSPARGFFDQISG